VQGVATWLEPQTRHELRDLTCFHEIRIKISPNLSAIARLSARHPGGAIRFKSFFDGYVERRSHGDAITEFFCQDSCAVCKIYLVKANDFNSQHIASVYSVDIAAGDTPETCGDTLLDHSYGAAHLSNELISSTSTKRIRPLTGTAGWS
jgi:hypothetical protein